MAVNGAELALLTLSSGPSTQAVFLFPSCLIPPTLKPSSFIHCPSVSPLLQTKLLEGVPCGPCLDTALDSAPIADSVPACPPTARSRSLTCAATAALHHSLVATAADPASGPATSPVAPSQSVLSVLLLPAPCSPLPTPTSHCGTSSPGCCLPRRQRW